VDPDRPRRVVFEQLPGDRGGAGGNDGRRPTQADDSNGRDKNIPPLDVQVESRLRALEVQATTYVTHKQVPYAGLALAGAGFVAIVGWTFKFLLDHAIL